jgi:hypothetical protein
MISAARAVTGIETSRFRLLVRRKMRRPLVVSSMWFRVSRRRSPGRRPVSTDIKKKRRSGSAATFSNAAISSGRHTIAERSHVCRVFSDRTWL